MKIRYKRCKIWVFISLYVFNNLHV